MPSGMGVVEGWEFPWLRPVLTSGPTSESAMVREQGGWVLAGSIASATLGFAFWALAARLFSADAVGTAGSLVGLSSLATSIGILGLDNGFVRFASRVARPRTLLWELTLIGGGLASVVGLALSVVVLNAGHVDSGLFLALVGLTVVLTTSQTTFQIMDAAILAARKSEYLAFRAAAYGLSKIAVLFALVGAGTAGLSAAYTLPLLVITIGSFLLVRRLWAQPQEGAPHSLRDLASLSAGNWLSGIAYSMPSRLGPPLMLIFLGPSPVAYFFIALQLAEVLNYIPESVSKSLYAHGSLLDKLPAALTSSMRRLLLAILVPLVALGVALASLGMTIVGGTSYGAHGLALQLFLLATLPKAGVQLYKAQFNVDRRPVALIVLGGALGLSTLAFFVVGLVTGVKADWLPLAWVLGGTLALGVGWSLSRTRGAKSLDGPSPR
jgi:O-antigen/teichoic acid export membrane protein